MVFCPEVLLISLLLPNRAGRSGLPRMRGRSFGLRSAHSREGALARRLVATEAQDAGVPESSRLGIDTVALDDRDAANLRLLNLARLAGANGAGPDELAVDLVAVGQDHPAVVVAEAAPGGRRIAVHNDSVDLEAGLDLQPVPRAAAFLVGRPLPLQDAAPLPLRHQLAGDLFLRLEGQAGHRARPQQAADLLDDLAAEVERLAAEVVAVHLEDVEDGIDQLAAVHQGAGVAGHPLRHDQLAVKHRVRWQGQVR